MAKGDRLMVTPEEILQNVNQPVIDHIVAEVKRGNKTSAALELWHLECHWLTKEETENFVNYIIQELGVK